VAPLGGRRKIGERTQDEENGQEEEGRSKFLAGLSSSK